MVLPLLLFALLHSPLARAGEPDPLADCRAGLRDAPTARESWHCVYMAARTEGAYEQATALAREELERHPDNAAASLVLGSLYDDQGLDGANEAFLHAAEGFAAEGEVQGEVYARLDLAMHDAHDDHVEAGQEQLRLAADVARAAHADDLLATVQIQQARLSWWRGRELGSAYRTLRALESERFDQLDYQQRIVLLHVLARLCIDTGRGREAMKWQERLVHAAEAENDLYTQATARVMLARWALGDEGGSKEELDTDMPTFLARTLEIAKQVGSTYAVADASCLMASVQQGAERDRLYRSSVDMYRESDAPGDAVSVLQSWAMALPPERVDHALALLDEAGGLLEDEDHLSVAYLDSARATVLTHAGRPAEALVQARRALDGVEGVYRTQEDDLGRVGVLARWSGVYHDTAALELQAGHEDAAWQVMERLRGRVLAESLAAAGGGEGAWTRDVGRAAPTLHAVRARLAPDEAMLVFQLPPHESASPEGWVWTITHAGVRRDPLPTRESLLPRLEVYEGLLQRADPDEPTAAAALYQALLQRPIASLPDDVSHLVLIPEGPLYSLPLDVLRPRADAPRLLDRFAVSVVPSAALWLAWRGRTHPPPRPGVLVLADPAFDPSAGLPRLPGARREAAAIEAVRPDARVLEDEAATEGAFDASDAPVLHLAAHAVLDYTFPEQSAILLAPDAEHDGRLQVGEIVHLDLHDRVVVLSACESAGGRLVESEGPLGLARAFFQAGSPTVVGSLWPLSDTEAEAFFRLVYERLSRGDCVQDAVAAARRARRDAGADPTGWAGIEVLGDGQTKIAAVSSGSEGCRYWPWILGIAVAAVLGAARFRKKG